jgi:hypothetical protein
MREREKDREHQKREGSKTQANEPGTLLLGFGTKC